MINVAEKLWDTLTGNTRVTLTETERMLVLKDGRFDAILGPGKHRIKRAGILREVHTIDDLTFVSPFREALMRERPDLARDHLTEFRAGPDEVVIVHRDGAPHSVLLPEARVVLWTDAGPWTSQAHAIGETLSVPNAVMRLLVRAGLTNTWQATEVSEGHVGILTVDGVHKGELAPGTHGFWKLGRRVAVKQVDLRHRLHEVTGQEILTRDRVTLRVNLTAGFRVVDAVRAVQSVKDFDEALHRALQLAFRRTLGAMTLDQLLANKVTVDAEAAKTVRAEMAMIGIEVGEIALKDVILPGEMREILNHVVAAEKEAEANVIRRREETNATRSLLNTAKVMAENPVMLRLKELEALENIAGKVERLTVHNGTEGLMTDVVRLRD